MYILQPGAFAPAAAAALLFDLGIDQGRAAPAGTDTQEQQAVPQGKDPPGADDTGQPPLAQQDGVIKPPPTGDEGIHTEVPNPNAGPGDEIAPPPQLPGAQNAEPK
jgi:hypothetical protein